MIDCLPDEQIENQFEVIMPTLPLTGQYQSGKDANIVSKALTGISNAMTSYTPIVEEITFTPRNFKTTTRRVRTGWCNVPEDIENYGDVSITMFCSSGMLTQYYLNAWKNLVFDQDGEYYNPMSVYKKNIEVFFFGPGNVGAVVPPVAHFTLVGCFPYNQDTYKLSYKDNPQRLRLTQKFKVDLIRADQTYAKSSIIAEMVTSPTSLIDKAITSLSSSASEYSTLDTYS